MNANKFNKWMIGAVALTLGTMAVACSDQPDEFKPTAGNPIVKYIRVSDPEKSDSLVVSAYLDNTIVLVGENLKSIHEMYFNDQKATINTSYLTDNTMIVDVPGGIPDVVTNKIYMINWQNDTTTYDFNVLVPSPTVTSMSCEWVKPGDEATLYGNYFIDDTNNHIQITMPGNLAVPYENIKSVTKTAVTFVVPEEATEYGQINVSTLYGSGRSKFMYHDERGILFDFDGKTGLNFSENCWHAQGFHSDEWNLTGQYVQLGKEDVTLDADGSWDDSNFALEYWPGSWDYALDSFPPSGQGSLLSNYADFTDWENMSLKFEMCIPSANPWKSGTMQLIFAGYDKVQLQNANNSFFQSNDLPRGMYRPWSTTGSYDTADKWITVTVPFSEFTFGWNGNVSAGTLTSSDFDTFTLFVVAGGVTGVDCQPIIKIDNIRAVPNL